MNYLCLLNTAEAAFHTYGVRDKWGKQHKMHRMTEACPLLLLANFLIFKENSSTWRFREVKQEKGFILQQYWLKQKMCQEVESFQEIVN